MKKRITANEQATRTSLTNAALILTSLVRRENIAEKVIAHEDAGPMVEVVLYQVWCRDEDSGVGAPTTDENTARSTRRSHSESTGHSCKIITSDGF